jgi:hypothetical protein
VLGFGNLFDSITLVRYNPDNSESERFIVPLEYATKELYVRRLEGDANLDKKVQITLPRMSYEMNGLSYDANRKQNTLGQNFTSTTNGVVGQYNPVPYDFDFSLYLYVRNVEDGTQIIEHILPYFTPDYTVSLNLIPELGIKKEVPIILKSTSYEVNYEGPRESDTRMIIWTLNFTVKAFIFGQSSSTSLITTSITNFLNEISPSDTVVFNMSSSGTGTYKEGELVYQGYSAGTATATAKVVKLVNNEIHLTNISGNFLSNQPIIGLTTNANYTFTSYQLMPTNIATIEIEPNPISANANSSYTYTTSIFETTPGITQPTFEDLMLESGTEDLSTESGSLDYLI